MNFPLTYLNHVGFSFQVTPKELDIKSQIILVSLSFVQKVIFISVHLHIKYIPATHYYHSPDSNIVSETEADAALLENCRRF